MGPIWAQLLGALMDELRNMCMITTDGWVMGMLVCGNAGLMLNGVWERLVGIGSTLMKAHSQDELGRLAA